MRARKAVVDRPRPKGHRWGHVPASRARCLEFSALLQLSTAKLRDTPIVFLRTLAFINYLGYAGWAALLYNFTVERANFQWFETGLTQSVREIPGFLAFTAIFWLLVVREQVLAYAALALMGLGVALTGQFPTLTGVLITTFIMSMGFHYFETMNVSLQLQLLPKAEADARAYGVSSTMKALGGADPKILQALASTSMKPEQLIAYAFQELAGKADKIGQLNISPDLLRELMTAQPARK